ncbi:MAG: GH92 family glycosyl hydrolase [Acidobacteriota bacterium]|nr:GH92 family glycosyl hydrolase [Acidobacteriota bacterium]
MKQPTLADQRRYFFIIFLFIFSFNINAQTKDFTRYVNPFIGTGGHGHTFPGATLPFGMVQLSPDTRVDNWDGSSGYHYSDSVIYGFSHTHLSGTGIPDYCDILFMPTIGKPQFFAQSGEKNKNGYASKFSHANETATPGYYSVKLDDDNIFAEMTATTHVGLHRYTFPKSDEANIILDLKWRDKVLDSELKIVGDNRIEGFRRSSSWAKDQIVYFIAEFSKPFDALTSNGQTINSQSAKGENVKTVLRFKTFEGEKVLLKVAISPVGIEGARKNLKAELPDWNFEKVRQSAKNAWNKELSKIEVSGGSDAQMTNFYTALYHTAIQPNIFQDVDGNYRGLDKKIHNIGESNANPKSKIQNPKSENYTVFSLWDTFRAAHPLYTIIDERRTADFINTFIRQYEQGGRLPLWELAGNETDTMIGYHAVSVIADAMAKGIKGFDYEKAFAAAKHSAQLNHFGLEAYRKRGYISMEDEQESVSKTLEYAYNDFCIAQMAKILMKTRSDKNKNFESNLDDRYFSRMESDYQNYIKRAQNYKNLYDRQTGFMRPKQNGNWIAAFQPNEVTFHFTEGNSWVYSFFVPHDVSGLMELHGGRAYFARKLDELFTTEQKLAGREQPDITGLIGQYAHGNEPSHHIAYLYNYADEPHKTQKIVRRIMDEFYKPTPDGLIGNEDCGQMSAWYILSSLGFYQVNPSDPVYAIGTPLFKEAKINLENGKIFTVRAVNVSDKNIYIKSAKLNGATHRKSFFTHNDLKNGGVLEFEMINAPVLNWFTESPVSKIKNGSPIVPTIEAQRVFENETEVKISLPESSAKIFYTTDGSEPTEKSDVYTKVFSIDKTSVIKAVSVNRNGEKSLTVESKINRMPHDWDVKLFSTYNRQYTGGGKQGLIDGIRGTTNFASGEWQGYQNQDFVAVIDLKKETEIKSVGGGFLQDARPWIWMPTRIEFETSTDGENFRKVAEIKTDVAPEDMKPQIKDYLQNIAPTKARYVRVKAVNLGKIPAWHPGAGFDAFIFVDEIFVR